MLQSKILSSFCFFKFFLNDDHHFALVSKYLTGGVLTAIKSIIYNLVPMWLIGAQHVTVSQRPNVAVCDTDLKPIPMHSYVAP